MPVIYQDRPPNEAAPRVNSYGLSVIGTRRRQPTPMFAFVRLLALKTRIFIVTFHEGEKP